MINLNPLWDWFRTLHETTGINLTIFYDLFDRSRFFNGFLTSLRLMGICLVASVAIGVVGAWVQRSGVLLLRAVTQGYDEVIVKTKNRYYDMRGTLDSLQFDVIKYEPAPDNLESKVYVSKRLGPFVLDAHRSRRQVVRA